MRVYLDQHVCEKLDLNYYEGHETESISAFPINIKVGSLLYHRRCWDAPHRELFAHFIIEDSDLRIVPSIGPGWYRVTNCANSSCITGGS